MFSPRKRLVAAIPLGFGHHSDPAPPIARSLPPGDTQRAVDLTLLPSGTRLVVETRNSRYCVVMLDNGREALVQGGRYFPQETPARIEGCTIGGCLPKLGWIVQGLSLELSICGKRIVTSHIRSISVNINAAAA
jgi:hypothetical protein